MLVLTHYVGLPAPEVATDPGVPPGRSLHDFTTARERCARPWRRPRRRPPSRSLDDERADRSRARRLAARGTRARTSRGPGAGARGDPSRRPAAGVDHPRKVAPDEHHHARPADDFAGPVADDRGPGRRSPCVGRRRRLCRRRQDVRARALRGSPGTVTSPLGRTATSSCSIPFPGEGRRSSAARRRTGPRGSPATVRAWPSPVRGRPATTPTCGSPTPMSGPEAGDRRAH